jgi:O-antigen ligase
MWVFGLSAVGSLVAIFLGFGHLVDPLKNESMVVGLFNHKNNLGRAGVFATLVFAISYFQNRRQHWFALAGFSASALAIILSETKTSYVTVPVILLAFPIYQILKQHYKLRAVILVATLLIGITASVWIFSNLDYILVDVLGKSESFNGRTGIWSAAIGQALEHPWLGYGLDGFWGSGKDFDLFKGNPVPFWTSEEYIAAVRESKAPSNAHNSYIQMLLEIGFLGVFMYLTSFFTTFTRSLGLFNSTSNPSEKVECLWYLQVLAAIVISGLTTSFLTNGAYWTLYVSIALSTAVQSIRIRHYRRLQKLGGQQSETEVLAT